MQKDTIGQLQADNMPTSIWKIKFNGKISEEICKRIEKPKTRTKGKERALNRNKGNK